MIRQTHRHTQTDGSIVIVEILVCTETEHAAVDQMVELDDWTVQPAKNQRKVIITRAYFEDEREPVGRRFTFNIN